MPDLEDLSRDASRLSARWGAGGSRPEDPANREAVARAALIEVRRHFGILDALLGLVASEAEAAAASGKRAHLAELARTAVQVQAAAGKCLASGVSLTNQIAELETEGQLRARAVELGYSGPRQPLASDDQPRRPLASDRT